MMPHHPGLDIGLYVLTWALLWGGASPTTKLLNRQLDPRLVPASLLEPRGQKFANCTGLALAGCLIALLLWGFIHIEWYFLAGLALSGITASIPLERMCGPPLMIYVAWVPTAILTVYLWAS